MPLRSTTSVHGHQGEWLGLAAAAVGLGLALLVSGGPSGLLEGQLQKGAYWPIAGGFLGLVISAWLAGRRAGRDVQSSRTRSLARGALDGVLCLVAAGAGIALGNLVMLRSRIAAWDGDAVFDFVAKPVLALLTFGSVPAAAIGLVCAALIRRVVTR